MSFSVYSIGLDSVRNSDQIFKVSLFKFKQILFNQIKLILNLIFKNIFILF